MKLLKLRAQRLVVVNLTIADEGDAAILAQEGLAPTGDINDRQAPVSQDHGSEHVDARAIRPTVRETLDGGAHSHDVRCRRDTSTGDESAHYGYAYLYVPSRWRIQSLDR